MDEPHYDIHVTPHGSQTVARRNGEPIPRLFRVEVIADVHEPSFITMWQFCDIAVTGEFGKRTIRHDCPDCMGHAAE